MGTPNGEYDELTADGNSRSKSEIDWTDMNGKQISPPEPLILLNCHNCDNLLRPIWFNCVKPKERKRIFKMKPSERMIWACGYWILVNLERNG